jgi:hypothetical protein
MFEQAHIALAALSVRLALSFSLAERYPRIVRRPAHSVLSDLQSATANHIPAHYEHFFQRPSMNNYVNYDNFCPENNFSAQRD